METSRHLGNRLHKLGNCSGSADGTELEGALQVIPVVYGTAALDRVKLWRIVQIAIQRRVMFRNKGQRQTAKFIQLRIDTFRKQKLLGVTLFVCLLHECDVVEVNGLAKFVF